MVWDSYQLAQGAAARSLVPFSSPRLDAVPALLVAAGFADIHGTDLTFDRVIDDPEEAIPRDFVGNRTCAATAN